MICLVKTVAMTQGSRDIPVFLICGGGGLDDCIGGVATHLPKNERRSTRRMRQLGVRGVYARAARALLRDGVGGSLAIPASATG